MFTTPTEILDPVMVYMAWDNKLDPEGVQDLKEMKKVDLSDKLNIVARDGAVNTGDPGRVPESLSQRHMQQMRL